jgi:hypothetical protein
MLHLIDKVEPEVMLAAEWSGLAPGEREGLDRAAILARFRGLPSIGFACGERCIGGVIVEHGFIHVSVLPEFHGKWGRLYYPALEWALAQSDPLYGMMESDNARCIRFSEQSGWERVGRYGGMDFYRSTRRMLERLRARRQATASP